LSKFNSCANCKALKIENYDDQKGATGFSAVNGKGNLFVECFVDGVNTNGKDANGIFISEDETKVINCIVDSTNSGIGNYAYGIRLTGTDVSFEDYIETATADHGNDLLATDWHSSGNYIAVGGFFTIEGSVRVYYFDKINEVLTEIASLDPIGEWVSSVAWSPDGQYLAIGAYQGTKVFIYKFDPKAPNSSNILTLIDSLNLSYFINALSWHPNGKYLAIGGSSGGDIYEFDGFNFGSSSIDSINDEVKSLAFSPDGKYLATSELVFSKIYKFSPFSGLEEVKTIYTFEGQFTKVDWSPKFCSGLYFIALGLNTIDSNLHVYLFSPIVDVNPNKPDDEILSLIMLERWNDPVEALKWSPSGDYIMTSDINGTDITLFAFDPLNLPPLNIPPTGGTSKSFPNNDPLFLDWSPSGRYVVVVGRGASSITTAIYPVLMPSKKCLIDNNKVCNTCCGFGYFGASSENLFIKNLGYNNTINFSADIINTYTSGLFGNPTKIENISLS